MSSVLGLVLVVWTVFTLPARALAADLSACYAMEARRDSAQESSWLPVQVGERKVKYPLQTDYSLSEQWALFIFQAGESGSEEFVCLAL